MVNREALEAIIEESGYRKKWIADQLNVSQFTFYNKLEGKSKWTYDEVVALCKILRITKKKRDAIFFSPEANVVC